MINVIGYLAAICLMLSGLPQVVKTIKVGNADGLSSGFLGLLLAGFFCMIVFVAKTNPQLPLIINYSVNLLSYLVISFYKIFPRRIK